MENKPKFKPDPKLRLMDQMRQVLRYPTTPIALRILGLIIVSAVGAGHARDCGNDRGHGPLLRVK